MMATLSMTSPIVGTTRIDPVLKAVTAATSRKRTIHQASEGTTAGVKRMTSMTGILDLQYLTLDPREQASVAVNTSTAIANATVRRKSTVAHPLIPRRET
jgi:hypothetical protein